MVIFLYQVLYTILDNYFGIPNTNYLDTKVYVGLGIEFDEETFSFSKEPVSKGFTITSTPCEFNEPVNGILRNKNAIVWPKATEDWTKGSDAIKYIGLYYRKESDSFQQTEIYDFRGDRISSLRKYRRLSHSVRS